uniref:Integrase catalytic domain-containing protein n=1 Tax=Cannabis sativa TaxID=3483 RepID=A0A803PDC4_CANSA
MATGKYDVKKFIGTNDFGFWWMKMKVLLVHQGLYEALLGEKSLPNMMSEKDKKETFAKAHSAIILNLGDKTLYSFKMMEDKSVGEQIDDFSKLILDLKNIDVTIEDDDQALLLLSSLLKSFAQFKDTMLYGRESITLNYVQLALNSKELNQRSESKNSGSGDGLYTRGRSEKRESHKSSKVKSRSKSKFDNQKNLRCWIYKIGHLRQSCLEKHKTGDSRSEGDSVVSSDSYDSTGALLVTSENSNSKWILDYGCSFNMTPNKSWFEEFTSGTYGTMYLGNTKSCKIVEIGTIRLKLYDGVERVLKDVRLVPDLKRNLISIGMLDDQGFLVKIEKRVLKVCKGSMVVMRERKSNEIYPLEGTMVKNMKACVSSKHVNETGVWHKRLDHVSEIRVHELNKQGLLGKVKLEQLDFYEYCVVGKACRVKFGTGKRDTKRTLNYVHSDLWEPLRTPSHSGSRYFLSTVDDYSRKLWVFILKNKTKVLERFKHWKIMIENQTGRKVKWLRIDNGMEYYSDEFNVIYKKEGIEKHKTMRKTPQQNGPVERFNRSS